MRIKRLVWLVPLAVPSLTAAHHAFRAVYDFSSTVEIKGSVASLELVNPHAFLYIDVADENGETTRWVVEGPGKLSLARRGWTDEIFAPGEMLTVVGNPSNVADREIWLEKIVRADGTEVIDPLVADELAIEEDRRLRIQRSQQR